MNTSVIHPVPQIGLVKLWVSQLERSLTYYTKVIGLTVLRQDDTTADLTADGHTVLFQLEKIESAKMSSRQSAEC